MTAREERGVAFSAYGIALHVVDAEDLLALKNMLSAALASGRKSAETKAALLQPGDRAVVNGREQTVVHVRRATSSPVCVSPVWKVVDEGDGDLADVCIICGVGRSRHERATTSATSEQPPTHCGDLKCIACNERSEANETRATVQALLRKRLAAYPEDIFPSPPPGQHGQTVDACSARAIRSVLQSMLNDLENEAANTPKGASK